MEIILLNILDRRRLTAGSYRAGRIENGAKDKLQPIEFFDTLKAGLVTAAGELFLPYHPSFRQPPGLSYTKVAPYHMHRSVVDPHAPPINNQLHIPLKP